jgi:hypothetical protein
MLSANFGAHSNDNISRVRIMNQDNGGSFPVAVDACGICGEKKAKMGILDRYNVREPKA